MTLQVREAQDADSAAVGRRMFVAGSASLFAGLGLGLGSGRARAVANDIGIVAGVGDQPEWRFCSKCFGMYYNGDGQGRKGSCPAGGPHQPYGFNFVLHYDHARRQPAAGRDSQFEWRFCSKCFGMFWAGSGDSLGRCPVANRVSPEFTDTRHHPYGFIFGLPHDSPANAGQPDWRFCRKCFGLFFDDPKNGNKGKCPAGNAHVRAGNSFNFQLPFVNEWIGPAPGGANPGAGASLPTISAAIDGGGTVRVAGRGFSGNASVTVRVVNEALHQAFIVTVAGQPIRTNAQGGFTLEMSGLCQASRQLSVSATDGRKVPSSVDLIGNLYSNTVTLRCP